MLAFQYNGSSLILSWPECPPAHLERTLDLGEFVNWATATNQVSYSGGQKTVTIKPTGNSAFYRLVLE